MPHRTLGTCMTLLPLYVQHADIRTPPLSRPDLGLLNLIITTSPHHPNPIPQHPYPARTSNTQPSPPQNKQSQQKNMADEIHDSTAGGTAKENIPTMSNPMDNVHGNVEDISNKASGYKVKPFLSTPLHSPLIFHVKGRPKRETGPPIRS